jgi:conjugative relaxase-like TrwC/TraI family protein
MFTMAKIRDGSTYLDKHLCANDYYAEGESVAGQWQGELAARLGLAQGQEIRAGDVAFKQLRENVNPATGEKLTQRNVEGSIRFFDFQCSAQKSVSVLHALTGDERLAGAHDRAAARAFAELESFAACRVRAGAAAWSQDTRATGNVCAAVFRHDASRALDPQLHTHFVVANATWDERQGRMVALESCEMVKAIRYGGKVYQNELAREVQALGYRVEQSRNEKGMVEGFEIQGVTAAVRQRFSKRRAEVEAGIAAFEKSKGRIPSAAEIGVITRQTRNEKMTEISTPAVRAAQAAQLTAAERKELQALTVAARQRGPVLGQNGADGQGESTREQTALGAAVAHRFERASVLKGHEVLAEALNADLGKLDLQKLKGEVRAGSAGLVALEKDGTGNDALSTRFATGGGIALEKWSVGFVNQGKGQCAALLPGRVTVAEWLSEEQKKAVRFVGASRDQVTAIRGVAGAGKTTLLKELDSRLVEAKQKLLYLAPTASAVKVLQSEGFTKATTVSEYLTKTQDRAMPAEWKGAVVVVDEAGLASNKQGAALLGLAEKARQRIVFVGDSRQHSSVESGDFLRVLEGHSKLATCELKDIRRQTAADYNQAVRLLASGQAAAGMERLDGMGWVKEEKADYLKAAAGEYLALSAAAKPKESVLCVAPTWAENHILTNHVRAGLRASGHLGEGLTVAVLDPLGWTTQQKSVADNYRPGQVVTFNRDVKGSFHKGQALEVERIECGKVLLSGGKALDLGQAAFLDVAARREIDLAAGDRILLRVNDKKAGLVNGDVLTVKGIGADGRIETAEGKTLAASYRQFTHGYVVTSHKSQGRTADRVVVAAARLDSKAAYVACSRGRQSCAVFTPEKESLFSGLPRSVDRQAALDVLKEQEGDRKLRAVQKGQFARAGALERTAAAAPMPAAPERPRVVVRTRERSHDLGISR